MSTGPEAYQHFRTCECNLSGIAFSMLFCTYEPVVHASSQRVAQCSQRKSVVFTYDAGPTDNTNSSTLLGQVS